MKKTNAHETTNLHTNAPVTESRLYNLLFAGRISIREYLQQVRHSDRKTGTA